MSDDNVKVAVRLRPFTQREKSRNTELIISMSGKTTTIKNPDNRSETKTFTFDHSYWSHDGFKIQDDGVFVPDSPHSRYASQQTIYDDLGQGILDNALKGYACSLFAYGQTGSGKSYSIMGYGPNKGIVPIICEKLFTAIQSDSNQDKKYQITFAMLEIYNERLRDLLAFKSSATQELQLRQSPIQGFYVQGLTQVPVGSYGEIKQRMEQGMSNRTIAATNMNETSSRAHTVVTLTVDQFLNYADSQSRRRSIINLVDLAGSERVATSGATGERLKEGACINRSLSALGNVISALADGKKVVPYRDSVLTKLLQNALGGNSKTIMIAAISPADINYAETMSTLRYADRAKQIKNKAVINEDSVEKLIRQLKEENERLKNSMKLNELPMTPANKNLTAKEREELKQQVREEMMEKMRANIAELEAQNQQKFQEKLEQARREAAQMALEAQAKDETSVGPTKVKPYLSNLNEDPQLSGVIQHLLVHKNTGLGRRQAGADDCVIGDKTQKVYWVHMQGLGIATEHAILIRHGKTGSKVELRVLEGVNKLTKVNGTPVRESVFLQHNDRILFGSHQLYLFKNPLAEKRDDGTETSDDLDWEYAQRELAEKTGFEAFEKKPKSKEDIILQKQLLELIPILAEANGIAEELGKNRTFDLLLVPPTAQGLVYGEKKETRIVIRMRDTTTNNIWLWDKDQFMEHRFTMQEMYQNFLGNSKTTIPKEEDPFLQPLSPRLVGVAPAFLQALGYRLDVDDKLRLTSIEGEEAGSLDFQIIPCTKTGKVLVDTDDSGEPDFVEDPHELLGRPFSFKVIINGITLFNSRDRNAVSVDYRIFRETKFTSIKFPKAYFKGPLSGRIPSDNERIFSIGPVTPEVLDYFANECICFMVYTSQDDRSYQDTNVQRKDKEICRTMSFVRDEEVSDINKLKTILSLTQKKLKRHSKRDEKIKRFIERYRQSPPTPENYKNVLESLANVFASQKSSPHTLNRSSASSNPPLNRTSRANDPDFRSLLRTGFMRKLY